jgi:hypothetical protein
MMRHSFISPGVFGPEAIAGMSEAFEAALEAFQVTGRPNVVRSHRRTNYCSGKTG